MGIIAPTALAAPAPEPRNQEALRNIEMALHGLYEVLDDEELERQNLVFASKVVMRQVALIQALVQQAVPPDMIVNEEKLEYLLNLLHLVASDRELLRSILVPTDRGFFDEVLDLTPPGGNS